MSVKSLLACTALFGAVICVAIQACAVTGRPSSNEVCDSEMQRVDDCWDLSGMLSVRLGLGPDGSAMLYYAGTGRPSGYRNSASFFAKVIPGRTYTFSAYVDATGHLGAPPYIILSSANGSWTGASAYQPEKGRVSLTFSIPRDSGTSIIKGSFATENGIYPIGRGASLSQPQIEIGAIAHHYVPSDDSAWTSGPPSGNLVANSEADGFAPYWTFEGGMRAIARGGPDGHAAIVYRGTGRASGYDSYATFLARVTPGTTYTFSASIDGSAAPATPPYVILSAENGTWQGVSVYQPDRGLVFDTFTIPANSGTTLMRGSFSTENGIYPRNSSATYAQPQVEVGEFPHEYAASGSSVLGSPPGGNLIADSELRRAPHWTFGGGMHQNAHWFAHGASAIVYRGNGMHSGFGDVTTARVAVTPHQPYTLTAYIDGSAHQGSPPYVWVSAANGSWPGAHTYQPGVGLTALTFSVPAASKTTCVSIEFSTQDGAYPAGEQLVIAQPQLVAGDAIYDYAATNSRAAACM